MKIKILNRVIQLSIRKEITDDVIREKAKLFIDQCNSQVSGKTFTGISFHYQPKPYPKGSISRGSMFIGE